MNILIKDTLKKHPIWNLLFLGLCMGVGFSLLTGSSPKAKENSCKCGVLTDVSFSSIVPKDNKLVTGQTQADCFAWSEFVSLNWPVDKKSEFGAPGDRGLVQWETYMNREVLLTKDGSKPPAWGNHPKAPEHLKKHLKGKKEGTKLLFNQHKFDTDGSIVLDEAGQAFPSDGAPNWLGAQNGTNIWYEVLVNQDEYNYFVDNRFYNADSQYAYVAAGNIISLPEGNSSQVGAIELKASWMEVLNPEDPKWNRYKLSNAVLVNPETGEPKDAVVALIGLHILHKTESQPTWFWATFDHIDNVPGSNPDATEFNLYNPDCQEQTVTIPPDCGENKNPNEEKVTVSCKSNTPPSYFLCSGSGPVPIQVTRSIPIDNDAQAVNKQLQTFIASNFPGSVWANYQLVNMIWSTTPRNTQTNKIPQLLNSMQPNIPISNPASETYIQLTTCFGCHQFAEIAPTANDPDPDFASDFSFVFKFAGYKGKK